MSKVKYLRKERLVYYSKLYNRFVTVPKGYPSDGATGAIDIDSDSWWVHDALCDRGVWDDGVQVNNWQASTVLAMIIWSEAKEHPSYYYRAFYWWLATWLMGGGKARENGMWWWQ